MLTKSVTIYEDHEEIVVDAPARWCICPRCEGEGKHSNPAIDGNGITSSEFAEWEPEERADYFSGKYDIHCTVCGGSGKLLAIDEDSFEKILPREFLLWKAQSREEEQYRRMCDNEEKWERRMLYGSD